MDRLITDDAHSVERLLHAFGQPVLNQGSNVCVDVLPRLTKFPA